MSPMTSSVVVLILMLPGPAMSPITSLAVKLLLDFCDQDLLDLNYITCLVQLPCNRRLVSLLSHALVLMYIEMFLVRNSINV